jgi:hypothetical protein
MDAEHQGKCPCMPVAAALRHQDFPTLLLAPMTVSQGDGTRSVLQRWHSRLWMPSDGKDALQHMQLRLVRGSRSIRLQRLHQLDRASSLVPKDSAIFAHEWPFSRPLSMVSMRCRFSAGVRAFTCLRGLAIRFQPFCVALSST